MEIWLWINYHGRGTESVRGLTYLFLGTFLCLYKCLLSFHICPAQNDECGWGCNDGERVWWGWWGLTEVFYQTAYTLRMEYGEKQSSKALVFHVLVLKNSHGFSLYLFIFSSVIWYWDWWEWISLSTLILFLFLSLTHYYIKSHIQFSRWVINVHLEMSLLKGLWGKSGSSWYGNSFLVLGNGMVLVFTSKDWVFSWKLTYISFSPHEKLVISFSLFFFFWLMVISSSQIAHFSLLAFL